MSGRAITPIAQWDLKAWVYSIALSRDGTWLVSGSSDCLVRIWDVRTGGVILEPLKGHTNRIRSVAISTDDTRIISGSDDDTIRMWDARTGASIGEPIKGVLSLFDAVVFSPDGTCFISGSTGGLIHIRDVQTGALIGTIDTTTSGNKDPPVSLAFSPDSTCFVAGMWDHTVRMWDPRTGVSIGEPLEGHSWAVVSVAFSPESTRILSGSYDCTIRIWDVRTSTPVGEPLKRHTDTVLSLAFSPDGTYFISGSNDHDICVWDASTGAPIGEPLKGDSPVWSVTFSPDGSLIYAATQNGISVWKAPVHVWETPEADPSFDMVSSKMTSQEMFDCLVRHGCSDLSSSLDASRGSNTVIASGGFGDVWRVTLVDGRLAAVKTLRLQNLLQGNDKGAKRAVREVYLWSKLQHPNVQQLLGVVVFQGGLGMVSPWMTQGNLKQHIELHPDIERYPLCVQVAEGVSYMHSINMVHGDLKANNVLVSDEGILKINDFDHAILSDATLHFSTTTRPGGGTLRWMAPELFQAEDEQTEDEEQVPRSKQTDIYALGMTMLEIVTGAVPYAEYRIDAGVYGAIFRKEFPRRPNALSGSDARETNMWTLLEQCWAHDGDNRPDASSALEYLKNRVVNVSSSPTVAPEDAMDLDP